MALDATDDAPRYMFPPAVGTDRLDDDLANAMVATGGLWAAISADVAAAGPRVVQLGSDGVFDLRPNELAVRFGFLKSAYRVTVTRIPDTELEAD